jgi:hypothetical protein
MDQKMQLKIQLAEKEAQILRLKLEQLENADNINKSYDHDCDDESCDSSSSSDEESCDYSSSSDEESTADKLPDEEFSHRDSLIERKDWGSGPLRHKDSSGKYFHGIHGNNFQSKAICYESPDPKHHRSGYTTFNPDNMKFHMFVYRENLENTSYENIWETSDPEGVSFCSHCELVESFPNWASTHTRRKTWFKCLGHSDVSA